ncbi:hypothetical protein D3C73_625860 [compost metagenome]
MVPTINRKLNNLSSASCNYLFIKFCFESKNSTYIIMGLNVVIEGHYNFMRARVNTECSYCLIIDHKRTADIIEQLKLW